MYAPHLQAHVERMGVVERACWTSIPTIVARLARLRRLLEQLEFFLSLVLHSRAKLTERLRSSEKMSEGERW